MVPICILPYENVSVGERIDISRVYGCGWYIYPMQEKVNFSS